MNPLTILTNTISDIQNKIASLETSINNGDNKVKEQICAIGKYNDTLAPINTTVYTISFTQLWLSPVYRALNSVVDQIKKFSEACTMYDTNKEAALGQLNPYITVLKDKLTEVQNLIDNNKKKIDDAYATYEKAKSMFKSTGSQVASAPVEPEPEPEPEPVPEVAAVPAVPVPAVPVGGYKRSKRSSKRSRQKSRKSRRSRRSRRKSIKKKSKKNRRR
jgi:peptidoglycan hydrolase CwlO-like protein